MKLYFIRHGKTIGNMREVYIGSTDQPLCEEGKKELVQRQYKSAERLFVSPMKRCIETADIIFHNQPYKVIEDLRECDFGDFEEKGYEELKDDPRYKAWRKSERKLPFPNGEHVDRFKERCQRAFIKVIEENRDKSSLAFVVHGGVIMAILECYGLPKKTFYEYKVKNGEGFQAVYDQSEKKIVQIEPIVQIRWDKNTELLHFE